jgi:hypothetical protein
MSLDYISKGIEAAWGTADKVTDVLGKLETLLPFLRQSSDYERSKKWRYENSGMNRADFQ